MTRVPDVPTEFLSRDECKALFDRCVGLMRGGGELRMVIDSSWIGSVRWARNRAHLAQDIRQTTIGIIRSARGFFGGVTTTQVDEAGLQSAMRDAERAMRQCNAGDIDYETRNPRPPTLPPILKPTLWSAATYGFDSAHRGDIVQKIIAPAESAGMLAAGELRVRARGHAMFTTEGIAQYYPTTRVGFSTTVRDAKGTGSGWAGVDDFDITRVNMTQLAERATAKCRTSVNAVALEPGRYTTILEPQAVADLWAPFMLNGATMARVDAEFVVDQGAPPSVPFSNGDGFSKISERVLDRHLTVSVDPMDPDGGFIPFNDDGTPYRAVTWIDQGVLRELEYNNAYALSRLGVETGAQLNPRSWRMSGGTTTVNEMIATTQRGLLVTRLHNVQPFHLLSFSCTGLTRDGVWLIENGKISKPVKNFRFTESPLMAFNRVEQVGVSQRVFSGTDDLAWLAPAIKVKDFNFTQLANAV